MDLPVVISNLKEVKNNLQDYFLVSINESEGEIREMIQGQLDRGIKGSGQTIRPLYSPSYAKRKGRTVPDLRLTGQYWRNIFTEIKGNVVNVDSVRTENGFDVAEHLEQKYGSEVLELTDGNTDKLREKVYEKVYKKIQDEIYG